MIKKIWLNVNKITEYSWWVRVYIILFYNFFLLFWVFELSQDKLFFLKNYVLNKPLPWLHHWARCRGYILGKKVKVLALMDV